MIVGEVDFFVLETEQIAQKCREAQGSSSSDVTWQHARTYSATYFGSDFNYATSREFRSEFRQMTQDEHLLEIGYIADMIDNGDANNA